LEISAGRLAVPTARPVRGEVVAGALARRGELTQVSVFSEVTCLEVEAQATSLHLRMNTFASGSDIHARLIPQGTHNNEYEPGAIPPEMPVQLAGARSDRIKRARAFHARAEATAEETRSLIALEAEEAYLRWEEAALEAEQAKEAAAAGDQVADDLNKDFVTGQKVTVPDVVNARVLASQARAQYNEYVYRQILALADLERITAGTFNARLADLELTQSTSARRKAARPVIDHTTFKQPGRPVR
jgi:outer membrane protein TolC